MKETMTNLCQADDNKKKQNKGRKMKRERVILRQRVRGDKKVKGMRKIGESVKYLNFSKTLYFSFLKNKIGEKI